MIKNDQAAFLRIWWGVAIWSGEAGGGFPLFRARSRLEAIGGKKQQQQKKKNID